MANVTNGFFSRIRCINEGLRNARAAKESGRLVKPAALERPYWRRKCSAKPRSVDGLGAISLSISSNAIVKSLAAKSPTRLKKSGLIQKIKQKRAVAATRSKSAASAAAGGAAAGKAQAAARQAAIIAASRGASAASAASSGAAAGRAMAAAVQRAANERKRALAASAAAQAASAEANRLLSASAAEKAASIAAARSSAAKAASSAMAASRKAEANAKRALNAARSSSAANAASSAAAAAKAQALANAATDASTKASHALATARSSSDAQSARYAEAEARKAEAKAIEAKADSDEAAVEAEVEAGVKPGGSNMLLYGAIGLAAVGGIAYLMLRKPGGSSQRRTASMAPNRGTLRLPVSPVRAAREYNPSPAQVAAYKDYYKAEEAWWRASAKDRVHAPQEQKAADKAWKAMVALHPSKKYAERQYHHWWLRNRKEGGVRGNPRRNGSKPLKEGDPVEIRVSGSKWTGGYKFGRVWPLGAGGVLVYGGRSGGLVIPAKNIRPAR